MKQTFYVESLDNLRDEFVKLTRSCVNMLQDSDKKGIEITIKTKSIRWLSQNSAMWCALTDISNQLEWHGNHLDPVEWKEMLTAGMNKYKSMPDIYGTGFVTLGARTSEMSVKEMYEFTDFIYAFGSQNGVMFSAPERE